MYDNEATGQLLDAIADLTFLSTLLLYVCHRNRNWDQCRYIKKPMDACKISRKGQCNKFTEELEIRDSAAVNELLFNEFLTQHMKPKKSWGKWDNSTCVVVQICQKRMPF